MSDEKYTIKLYELDYHNQRTETGEVSASTVARCMSHANFVYLFDCYLNYGGKGYLEGLSVGMDLRRTHRTLQRSAVAFAIGLLVGIAEQDYTDGRNETAIATAKKIAEMHENGELPLGSYL